MRIKYRASGLTSKGGQRAAVDFLGWMLHYFEGFGPVGLVLFLFAVLCVDAMVVPTVPEFFVMAFYSESPSFGWGVTLLAVVLAAELAGNALMYEAFSRFKKDNFVTRKMMQWTNFLVVKDERVLLVNRFAPILPFSGAFIAVRKWDVKKSFFYIFLGGAIKYSLLIALVAVININRPPEEARNITLIAIIVLVAVSLVQGFLGKRKHLGPVAARVAHLGEPSPVAAPSPGGGENEGAARDGQKAKQKQQGEA